MYNLWVTSFVVNQVIMTRLHQTHYHEVYWYDVAFLMFDLSCSICSGVAGAIFANVEEADRDNGCKLDAPLFLIIGAVGNLVLSTVRFLYPAAGSILQLYFNFIMIIYGSALILGNKVDINNPSGPHYCNELQFRYVVYTVIFFVAYFLAGIVFYILCACGIICYSRLHDEEGGDGKAMRRLKSERAYHYSSGYIYCSLHFIMQYFFQSKKSGSRLKTAWRILRSRPSRCPSTTSSIVSVVVVSENALEEVSGREWQESNPTLASPLSRSRSASQVDAVPIDTNSDV